MSPLYFRGSHRIAAKHLIAATTLGGALEWAGSEPVDDGQMLSIIVSDDAYDRFSSGEKLLFDILASFNGKWEISLADIAPPAGLPTPLDTTTRMAVLTALAIAVGSPSEAAA